MTKEKARENSDSRIASLKNQDKEYNRMYYQWRIDRKNDYGFYFLDNSDELTYRNGEGFITEYPEAAERAAVNETNSIVGITLIMYLFLRFISGAAFTYLPLKFGWKISYESGVFFTGSEVPALIMSYVVNILTRIVPIFFLIAKTGMPLKLILPAKPSNMPLFRQAVPMAMLVFGIGAVFSGISLINIGYGNTDEFYKIWLPSNPTVRVLSAVQSIFIVPLISELIHRGIFMNIFRQFGDGYALVLTSMIFAFTSGTLHTILFFFIYSLVIGYFTIRTGSVLTAIIMRTVISASSYLLTLLRYTNLFDENSILIALFIVFAYILAGTISIIIFMKNHSNRINLPLYQMYLSFKDKMLCFAVNPTIIIWTAFMLAFHITGPR